MFTKKVGKGKVNSSPRELEKLYKDKGELEIKLIEVRNSLNKKYAYWERLKVPEVTNNEVLRVFLKTRRLQSKRYFHKGRLAVKMRFREEINLGGRKGDSLFSGLGEYPYDKKEADEAKNKVNNCLRKYFDTLDDRAFALIGALIVENELDNLLTKWIKDYKHIAVKRDFSFSFKVNLAISFKLIPPKILKAIEPIRRIRNIFAHCLDIDTFEKAKEFDSKSNKGSFRMLNNKIRMFSKTETALEEDKLSGDFLSAFLRTSYLRLTISIVLGLGVYARHLAKVQDYIWEPKNLDEIMKTQDS